MSRRIQQDGKFFRIRRGKLVQIPPEWVGITRYDQHWHLNNKRFWVRREVRKKRRALKRELFHELMSL